MKYWKIYSILFYVFLRLLDNAFATIVEQPLCRILDPSLTYFCPVKRYCEWDYLIPISRTYLRNELGYTRKIWNYEAPFYPDIEEMSFEELTKNQSIAFDLLGFDKDSFDCCLNHYSAFDWSDFSDEKYLGVKNAWQILGYNENNWDDMTLEEFLPPYEDMFWDDLPEDVKLAASKELCYSKNLWDDVGITLWTNATILPGAWAKTASPSTSSSFLPSLSPSQLKIVNDPFSLPTTKPSQMEVTSEPSVIVTENLLDVKTTFNPSVIASTKPTSQPTAIIETTTKPNAKPTAIIETTTKPTAIIETTTKPTATPTSIVDTIFIDNCRTLNPDSEYFCPVRRYCEWDYFDFASKNFMRFQMGYERSSWDYYTINRFEQVPFSNLNERVRSGLTLFAGYDEDTHDCCQGHYNGYSWADFTDNPGYEDVIFTLDLLGFNQDRWDGDLSVPYYELSWDELPDNLQIALRINLCYSRETWNQLPLDLWRDDVVLPGEFRRTNAPTSPPTSTPELDVPEMSNTNPPASLNCHNLDPDKEYRCPVKRYCEWDKFDFESRQTFRSRLDYNESQWNYDEHINPIEKTVFKDLDKSYVVGLRDLGFDEDRHNCCHNHYTSYDWEDFMTIQGMNEIMIAYEMLGYDEETWENDEVSEFDDYLWDELPSEVRSTIYKHLCYNKELWDGVPLTAWSRDALLPGVSEKLDTKELFSSSHTLKPMPMVLSVMIVLSFMIF